MHQENVNEALIARHNDKVYTCGHSAYGSLYCGVRDYGSVHVRDYGSLHVCE